MKIIDALWEKNNLGVSCKEIVIERVDSIQALRETIVELKTVEYLVIKVPTARFEMIQFLTKQGFCFIETLFEMLLDIANFTLPEKLTRLDENITYHLLHSSDLDTLGCEIKKGIFITDRIALDPRFGIDIAARRYLNWINDEVAKGNFVYEILNKEKPTGFFTLKQIGEKSFNNFLAGMYVNKSNFGLGFSIISKPIEEIKKRHGQNLIANISSNNPSVIRLYAQFGFIPNSISYVMIRNFD